MVPHNLSNNLPNIIINQKIKMLVVGGGGEETTPVSHIFGVCVSGTGQQERMGTAPLSSKDLVAIVVKPKMSDFRK